MTDLTGKLEPEASDATSPEAAALISIAVSLKRISDAMNTPNMYGEVGSEALANSIYRGLQDGHRPHV